MPLRQDHAFGDAEMRKLWQKISGGWRLRFGFCPMCDSSPPRQDCPVCLGSYEYGHQVSADKRREWWDRYLIYVEKGLPW